MRPEYVWVQQDTSGVIKTIHISVCLLYGV